MWKQVLVIGCLLVSCSSAQTLDARAPTTSSSSSTTTSTTTTSTTSTSSSTSTTTTTTTVAPIQRPANLTTGAGECALAELIHQYFDPYGEGAWAVQIAYRESRCQPDARSSTNCLGTFQVCSPLHDQIYRDLGLDPANWSDAETNIKVAAELYRRAGKQPWRT